MNDELTERLRGLLRELRSGKDRRQSIDPNYKGPERRIGKDRRSNVNDELTERIRRLLRELRSGKDRRQSVDPNYKGPERRIGKDRRS